ncbi:response regulator transcription factor [Aquipuribacter sp. MA13-6]|uniref:response regulator transcription factor n=1 Tax=unclassified Aquipuribacter TaxID=2635084 RepID=UPI003EEBC876
METTRQPDLQARAGAAGRVLVVDDDVHLADVVSRYLLREGYGVETVGDGATGLDRALATLPDVVVLDLMLPGLSGLEVFRRLREVAPVPVVMLTARGREEERIAGLELGADDYVGKPFSPRELTARVGAVLRRARGEVGRVGGTRLRAGELELDPSSRQLRRRGRLVDLTRKEFDLLAFVMARPGQAFRREDLLEAVWGYSFGDTTTVTVHVRRIREKVEASPAHPRHLSTVRGVGYRFDR